jgi:hypothetical protein
MTGPDIEKIWWNLTSVDRKAILDGLGVRSIDPHFLEEKTIDYISCMGDLNSVPPMVRNRLDLSFTGKEFSTEQYNEKIKLISETKKESSPLFDGPDSFYYRER